MPPPYTLFVANARTALKIALHQMGMQVGDKILVPDFICDVVLHPILQKGLIPVYYPITQNLTPDWPVVESIVANSNCRALIMVHYFGQPQNVERFRSFCTHHNLFLIEDNAHGHGGALWGKPLGSFGDVGISSPRKTLGTPSGGILYGANSLSSGYIFSLKPFPAYYPVPILKLLLQLVPRVCYFIKGMLNEHKNWDDPYLFHESLKEDCGVDRYSRWRIVSANWASMAKRRRENWISWSNFLCSEGLQPVFPEVHPESCPWAMPAYARDQRERNQWLMWGAKHRVPVFPWPALPEEIVLLNGNAFSRWKTLVCFPLDYGPTEFGLPSKLAC